jgi:hypothetical protein
MVGVLSTVGVIAVLLGVLTIFGANGAIHEIEGILSLGFGSLLIGLASILHAINHAIKRLAPSPALEAGAVSVIASNARSRWGL